MADLERIILEPKNTAKFSVIWLHGLGADGNDFVPVVKQLNLPEYYYNHTRFIFPHAPKMPVFINNNYIMPAWFNIYGLNRFSKEDGDGLTRTQQKINALIESEYVSGVDYSNIVLIGFSQGGAVALYTGLKFAHKLAGIIGLSCYLPQFDQHYNVNNKNTALMLAHGTDDEVVSYDFGKAAYDNLTNLNYAVNWHSYKMGHSVCNTEIEDIAKFLMQILSSDPKTFI